MNSFDYSDYRSNAGEIRIQPQRLNDAIVAEVKFNSVRYVNQFNFEVEEKPFRHVNNLSNKTGIQQRLTPPVKRNRQHFVSLDEIEKFVEEIQSLTQFYIFNDARSVRYFLKRNRFLVPVLKEAAEQIFNYFGTNQKLVLDVSVNSNPPQSEELWINILTTLGAEEAYPKLELFDEGWWLENINRADTKLNITLEYI